jgi:hypothetical protein
MLSAHDVRCCVRVRCAARLAARRSDSRLLLRGRGAQDALSAAAERVAGAQGAGGSGAGRYELVNTAVTAASTPEARACVGWRLFGCVRRRGVSVA